MPFEIIIEKSFHGTNFQCDASISNLMLVEVHVKKWQKNLQILKIVYSFGRIQAKDIEGQVDIDLLIENKKYETHFNTYNKMWERMLFKLNQTWKIM